MGDEYSDILGGDTLPIRRNTGSGQWSGLSFTIKSTFTLALLLVAYVLFSRAWEHVLKWREKSYKLSLRRRHGIPDNDHRPFNVAYAAVQRAREQREKENARIRRADRAVPSSQQPPQERARYRPGSQRNADISRPNVPAGGLPGRFTPASVDSYAASTSSSNLLTQPTHSNSNRVTFADGYNTSASPLDTHAELVGSPKRSGRKSLGILKSSDDRRKRERGFDDYGEDGDIAKKTRLEGDELIDGDEEAAWQDSHLSQSAARGSKRGLGDEEERTREKRPRKVSADKSVPLDEDMEVDDEGEDQISDLRSISRGKKRDRAEAGSSFGGEEEEEEEEREVEDDEKSSRRRKRRNKRRSDAGLSTRGRKRDRDIEDETGESDDETGAVSLQIARKKRGKKNNKRQEEEEKLSDVSMEDSSVVSSKGRKIGEEWTSNGVCYKIGPNGQRLRLELVKKARQKFIMPLDSVHPDRKANMEVYIEAWLTEEEYRDAKAQQLLSWQESPKASTEPETPPVTTPKSTSPPARTGKHLLWESTSTPPIHRQDNPFENPPKPSVSQDAFHRSIVTNVGLNINPFPSRRIASAVRIPPNGNPLYNSVTSSSPGLADSTNSLNSPRTYRQYSKWEKQDLEAKAMMRMREANRKKEEEKEKKEREEREKKEKERLALAPPEPPTIPKIVLTKAAEEKSDAPKPTGFSFPPASSAPTSATPAAGSGENKAEPPKPSASSTPGFSFAKPATSTPTLSTPAPSSAPASSAPAPSAAPFTSPFSFAPASAATAKPQEKPKSSLGLGFPSTPSAPSSAPAAPTSGSDTANNASSAPPKFSFGVPPKAGGSSEPNTAGASTSTSNPLLSRMAGAAPPAQGPAPASTSTTSTPSAFSFAPTAASPQPTAPSPSPFGAPAASQSQSSQQPLGTAPPKFNFGINNKAPISGTTTTPAAAAATSSSLSGALNPSVPGTSTSSSSSEAPKASAFSFANPNAKPEESSAGASGPGTATTAPKFSFGVPAPGGSTTPGTAAGSETTAKPGISIFGAAASMAPGAAAPTTSTASPFGGASTTGNSIFGAGANASKDAAKSGPAATNNIFGSTGAGTTGVNASPFGGAGSGNVFGAKPAMGSSNASSPFGAPSGTTGTGGAFSFGAKPQTETPAPASGSGENKPTFPFGNPSSMPATTGGAASSSSSPFGAFGGGMNSFGAAAKAGESKPSGFSFGQSTPAASSSTPSSEAPKTGFAFGTSPAAPSTPGAQTSSSSAGTTKSAFSFPNTSTTPAGTPSSGAAPGGFSFGASPATGSGGGGLFKLGGNTMTSGAAPVFGAPSTGPGASSSPFGGFGSTGTGTSTGSPFSFGSKPAEQSK